MTETGQFIAVDIVHFVDGNGREIIARFDHWEIGDEENHDYAWLITDDPLSYRNILAIYSNIHAIGTWHYGY